ncbi:MAG: hypothetical protein HYZ28_07980 [Myxococcales bacterium]|nr:hypothetical protein [Myxococcales bacterium]
MTPLNTVLAALEAHGCNPQESGGQWAALCPAHEDSMPSLSLTAADDGRVLVKCHGGCSFEEFARALDLPASAFFAPKPNKGLGRIVAAYSYTDEAGALLFEVVRFEPKTFRQRRPDGKGGWVWSIKGVRQVLYHDGRTGPPR